MDINREVLSKVHFLACKVASKDEICFHLSVFTLPPHTHLKWIKQSIQFEYWKQGINYDEKYSTCSKNEIIKITGWF